MGACTTSSRRRLAAIAVSLLLAGAAAACRSPRPQRWNVLLVTFDTTRADHIGCYGRPGARTPTVDRLAADGIRFAQAYSSIPLTCPSHSTIMTGKYPFAHGVRDNGLFVLAPEQRTLAELLADKGYRTAAAVGGFPLVKRFGLDQGFELYDDRLETRDATGAPVRTGLVFEERRAARVNEPALAWLEKNASQPFFLWLHYYDPHQPRNPPAPYDQTFANDLYDGEIAYADESLGVVIDRLQKLGVYDRTLVVFTSDHGEGLDEHREQTHSYLLYNSTLHVPLIVRPPRGPRGRVVEDRVRLVDLAPTVLELLGLEPDPGMQGRSLVQLFDQSAPGSDRPHYAETLSPRLSQNWGELRALFEGHWKYVHGPKPELFDLSADPRELNNLVAAQPERAAAMREHLAEFLRRYSPPGGTKVVAADEETRQRLFALGYLAAGAGQVDAIAEELRSDGIAPQDRAGDISLVSAARELLQRGNQAATARELARQLLANAPDDPFYLEILATAELQLERPDEALAAVEKILAGDSRRGSAERLLLYIGQALVLRGDLERGMQLVQRSVERRPTAEGAYLLASLQERQGERRAQLASLRRALDLDPKYAPARVDLAAILAQQGRRDLARTELDRALLEAPYFAKAHYNMGVLRLESGEIEAALAYFDRAVVLDPHYTKARYAAVAVKLQLGQRAAAQRAAAELARLAPNSDEARQALLLMEANR